MKVKQLVSALSEADSREVDMRLRDWRMRGSVRIVVGGGGCYRLYRCAVGVVGVVLVCM